MIVIITDHFHNIPPGEFGRLQGGKFFADGDDVLFQALDGGKGLHQKKSDDGKQNGKKQLEKVVKSHVLFPPACHAALPNHSTPLYARNARKRGTPSSQSRS